MVNGKWFIGRSVPAGRTRIALNKHVPDRDHVSREDLHCTIVVRHVSREDLCIDCWHNMFVGPSCPSGEDPHCTKLVSRHSGLEVTSAGRTRIVLSW